MPNIPVIFKKLESKLIKKLRVVWWFTLATKIIY
jgi:hypothetical protein